MEIIIDTNFILTCVKQKIDLFSQLRKMFPASEIAVPLNVISELDNLSRITGTRMAEKEAAGISLQLIKRNKIKILELNGNVDESIVAYALGHREIVVASLDKGIKNQLKNAKFLTIKRRKLVSLA